MGLVTRIHQQIMYHCPQIHILLLLLLAALASGSKLDATSLFNTKYKDDGHIVSSKSFFSGGTDSLAWDSEDLTEVRELRKRQFKDQDEYMQSFHLAEYLNLHMVDSLHMPIPLNIIFIGFSGDGNMDVNITKDELVSWFEHLDHVLPHTRISLTELSCLEDGHCSAYMKAERPAPLRSYVHLNMSCHIVDLDSKTVLGNFERAIAAFSRPVDPKAETGAQQVDGLKMEKFVDNFIKSLGFVEHYSIVVINPKWSAQRPQYGYRMGFSQQELDFLRGHRIPDKIMGLKHMMGNKAEPTQRPLWSHSWDNPWTYPRSGAEKFKIHDAVWNGKHWSRSSDEYLAAEEAHRSFLLKMVGGETGSAAMVQALRVLASPLDREWSKDLAAWLLMNPDSLPNPSFPTAPSLEDCMVHSWVSHERWLLIDLTAGGYEWGPALGGEGIVHQRSLPNVQEHFFVVKEAKYDLRMQKMNHEHDVELRTKLDKDKSQRLGAMSNQHYHAFFRQHQVDEQNKAPGARVAQGDSLQLKWERHHNQLLQQAELDLLEEFAKAHCANRTEPPPVCAETRTRVEEITHGLQAAAATTGNIVSTEREHKWDIFGNESELDDDPNVFSEAYRQKDLFLAQLSAIMSRGIRHVIAPPMATWHHDGYLHDTATPYAQEVTFELYLIKDHSRALTEKRRSPLDFPVDDFKVEVDTLKLSHQTFRYTVRDLSLMEDQALATSFSASLRTTFQQVPMSKEKLFEYEQLYLDSHDLAKRLRAQFGTAPRRGHARAHAQLIVPIFVFMLDRDSPVLVDQHYNARALEDMVVVVQNAARQDEHPVGFSCNGKLQSRVKSPLKEALAAVLQHLGGVLPPHLGYRPLTHSITLDWFWSVGAHPFSATSSGTSYSKLQRDALHRSYVLDAVDTSIDRVNQGLYLLTKQAPEKGMFTHIQQNEKLLKELLSMYADLVMHWHAAIQQSHQLAFSAAIDLIPMMEITASKFLEKCQDVQRILHPLNCRAQKGNLSLTGWLPHPVILLCATVGVCAGVYSVYATNAIRKDKKH